MVRTSFMQRIDCISWILLSALLFRVVADKNQGVFSILDNGAVGDGKTNDTLAFTDTWYDACNAEMDTTTMMIPGGKEYLVHQITFFGPCKPDNINIQLSGVILAPGDPDKWSGLNQANWIVFKNVTGLSIGGAGLINGLGKRWWDTSCRYHPGKGCNSLAPTVLSFKQCNNVRMSGIAIINSPQTHILVLQCFNVDFGSLTITAPENSPNTDGIHIHASQNVFIYNTGIASGDDCISIGDHTSNIDITNVNCGPGHGISIGSLGKSGNEVQVENIRVSHVNFYNTSNGVRIKTWQVGRGHVRQIIFEHLNFISVKNPIIIDQHYCDIRYGCNVTDTGVHISDVTYYGLYGTSKTDIAVNLNCSESVPCTRIVLDAIYLAPVVQGMQVISSCNNAFGFASAYVEPDSCLLELS